MMKRALAMIIFLLLVLPLGASLGQQPAPAAAAGKSVIRTVDLKCLTPEQAVKLLTDKSSQFTPLVPKGILDIVGLKGAGKLLIKATDDATLDQMIALITQLDQPDMLPALTQAYIIEVKNISPGQAIKMLQGEDGRYKSFVPKEITEIIALPNSKKLLVQTTDAQAALRLTQLISLIDQPAQLALQVMLINVAPPQPGGEGQPMPTVDGRTPITPAAMQAWVQSLIDTRRGSVILFPDQSVTTGGLFSLTIPPFVFESSTIFLYKIAPGYVSALTPIPSTSQSFTADMHVFSGHVKITTSENRGELLPGLHVTADLCAGQTVNLIVDQTVLVPIELQQKAEDGQETVKKQYILAFTPKLAPPSIQGLGLASNAAGPSGIEGAAAPGLPGVSIVTN